MAASDKFYKLATAWDDLPEIDQLAQIYSDVYKDKHGIRPRWMNFDSMSVEELKEALKRLEEEPDTIDYGPPSEMPEPEPEYPEMEGTVSPDSAVDWFEKEPTMSGMGKRR